MGIILLPMVIIELITSPFTFPIKWVMAFAEEIKDGFDFKRLFSF